MARFHLDHNVSNRIATVLRDHGHDVVTAWDLGLMGADDDVHLSVATDDRRVLVTQNKDDFILLHRAWRRWSALWRAANLQAGINVVPYPHTGILIIPQSPHMTPDEAAMAVHHLILLSAVSLDDELYRYDWQTGQGWVREPRP